MSRPDDVPTQDGEESWLCLLDDELLALFIEDEAGFRRDAPRESREMVRSLNILGVADAWVHVLRTEERASAELLQSTIDGLLEKRHRPDLVGRFVVLLLAANLNDQFDSSLDLAPSFSSMAKSVALATLAGFIGKPDVGLVSWFLEQAAFFGADKARELRRVIAAAINGDTQARREVVSSVLPYWNAMLDGGLLGAWDVRPEDLGFPYSYAEDIKDDADVLTLRAKFLYVYGHSGDEDPACKLAVEAAFMGSAGAWNLLSEWTDAGDSERVVRTLLKVGRLRFSGSGDDPDAEEDVPERPSFPGSSPYGVR